MLGIAATLAAQLGLSAGVMAQSKSEPAGREMMRTEKQIQANLQSDRDLANNRIDVSVSDGVATLKGAVDSEAERAKAARLATVAGVRVVDDQLKVESEGMTTAVTDGAVTTKIKAQYLANTALRQAKISVTTNNAVVTLSGTVPSAELRDLAVTLARNTGGVARVEDQLRVSGSTSPPLAPTR